MSLKTRIEKEANYRSVWCNGKTLRFAIDPKKPITELKYPEFYDVKVTGNCDGACPWCYMDSKSEKHYENIIDKFRLFFGNIDKDKLPFQIAFGGGEPTSHPDFIELMKVCKEEFDICPNYTTNGMWWTKDNFQEQANLLNATKQYCGGVAISCHPHLKQYWLQASEMYIMNNIKLNFHIIISDKESIDDFIEIYNEWKDKVDYFVLLPYGNVGRAPKKEIDWEYLVSKLPEDQHQIAFGANFYPYLLKGEHNIKISLYEPEIMSKYMDLKDMNIYPSSFNLNKIN
jgi:organic radical activating enzyme